MKTSEIILAVGLGLNAVLLAGIWHGNEKLAADLSDQEESQARAFQHLRDDVTLMKWELAGEKMDDAEKDLKRERLIEAWRPPN